MPRGTCPVYHFALCTPLHPELSAPRCPKPVVRGLKHLISKRSVVEPIFGACMRRKFTLNQRQQQHTKTYVEAIFTFYAVCHRRGSINKSVFFEILISYIEYNAHSKVTYYTKTCQKFSINRKLTENNYGKLISVQWAKTSQKAALMVDIPKKYSILIGLPDYANFAPKLHFDCTLRASACKF